MRQFAAFLILIGLFIVLVGTQFRASDGDRLAAVARLASARIHAAMPPAVSLTAPVDALRKELPTRPEDAVRSRLAFDRRLAGLNITVVADDGAIKLRGVVPDERTRNTVISLAQNTTGIERVVDELALPAD